MRETIRIGTALLVGAAACTVGCGSSPHGVEVVEVDVSDRVATHDGLEVAWTRVNYGWVPTEGPIPDREDSLTVTIELRVRNVSDEGRSFAATDLLYRTWDRTFPYDPPRNTPVWTSTPTGREPLLEPGRLEPGEEASGWRTYRVPREAPVPDAFVWRPPGDRSFTFSLPISSASIACGASRIFGVVTTEDGAPVPEAGVELVHYDLSRAGNAFEGGRCLGEPNPQTILAETDEGGRFEDEQGWRFCDERCFEATVTAPPGSGLADARAGAGTVFPSPPHPLVEPYELRIDAVLPPE